MYLTPARVPTMGLGVDLTGVSSIALRSAISRASSTIDSVCAVPRTPVKFDFKGGIVTSERHDWIIDPDERPKANRFYPFCSPVLSVERFDIFSDNVNKVAIDPSGVVINNSSGWIEASSLLLTQYGVFGAGIVPYVGLYHPIVEVDYTYGSRFAVVDEVAEFIDGQSYQAESQFWTAATVTVKVNGATKTLTTDYTLDRVEGRVVFVANLTADDVVTVSYTYSLDPDIRDACALLLAEDLGEAANRAKGLTGLTALRVQSGGGAAVEIERRPRAGAQMSDLPGPVQRLLAGHVFVTLR